MTYKEVLDFWETKKPIRSGKTLWLMIAEAIEKQIPKKPLHSGIFYDCPKCLETVGHVTQRGKLVADHHCKCGQLIDWSEE